MAVAAATGCQSTATSGTDTRTETAQTTVTPTTSEVSVFERDRRDGVERLLGQWATALRSADHAALRELIDPAAAPEFVEAQAARADAMAAVDFAEFEYVIIDGPETPVPPRIAAEITATDLWAPEVELRYAIADSDERPAAAPVSLVVTRHGDHWNLLSDAPLEEYRRVTHPAPWDFGPLVVERIDVSTGPAAAPPVSTSPAVAVSTVIGHPDRRSEIEALAAQLPTAVSAVTDLWGTQWAQRAVVYVASTADEFDGLVSGGRGTTDPSLAAATIAGPTSVGAEPTGQRIVFGPRAAAEFTDRSRETVLRHELTHVAARSVTGEGAPLWLLEGFADYTAYRDRGFDFAQIAPTLRQVVREHGPPTVLPGDDAFAAGGAAAALAYESAWSIADYVAWRYSPDALIEMYRALAGGPLDPVALDDTLERLFGTTARGFVADWGARVNEQARAQG